MLPIVISGNNGEKLVNFILKKINATNEHLEIKENAEQALAQVTELGNFKCQTCKLTDLQAFPEFLEKEEYNTIRDYLPESTFFAATIGLDIDNAIRKYQKNNLAQSVLLNFAANVALDECVDTFLEKKYPNSVLFCTGRSGTNVKDNELILIILHAKELLGIYQTKGGTMIPEKSVCGLILKNYKFSCRGCLISQKCQFLKEKTTCY